MSLVQCDVCQGLLASQLSRCPHCDTQRRKPARRRGRLAVAVGLGSALSSCAPLIAAYGICMLPDGGICDSQPTQDAGQPLDGGEQSDGGGDGGQDSGTP